MGKIISKKVVAVFLSAIMVIWGLPLNVFAETEKSTKTFASEPETIQVSRSVSFNSGWKFKKYDVDSTGPEATDFDDSEWRTLDLPHDWSIESKFTTDGESESGFLLGGIGWYRKTFQLSESYANKRVSIEFGGVYMNATVYVNGTELGTHPYGYTPFAFDITDYLNFDGTDNVIAVKVNHQIPSSRWYSGSGIYRNVNLVVTDNVHVKRYGTKVTTPNLESKGGKGDITVKVATDVKNDSNTSATVTVKNTVYDNSNTAVSAEDSDEVTIESSKSQTVTQNLTVSNPKLWSVDSPNMYYVKTQILNKDNQVIDEYTTDFGFRYFDFDKNTGFSLNGTKIKLKGVCMHHDQGALGSVANYSAIERQVKKLKAMGCNAIRVTHNPASDELLEICNKEGIMIIEEAFDTWSNPKNGNSNDYSSHFNEEIGSNNKIIDGSSSMTWAEFDIKQMVNRGKNNPCIIMWSIGNEVLEGISGSTSNYTTYAQNLVNWVKEIDTTRPTTMGDNKSKDNNSTAKAMSDIVDVAGLNYCSDGQYSSLYTSKDDWKIYGSETSSAIRSRGVYTTKGQDSTTHQITSYDKSKVSWGRLALDSWGATIAKDYIAGEFVWTGFDYIGEPTPWIKSNGTGSAIGSGPYPKSSYFGIIDTAGFEKDIYYFYQSQWNDNVHTLHILPCWDEDSIYKDSSGNVEVVVYSDAKKVNLSFEDKDGNKTDLGTKEFTKTTTSAGYTYQKYNSSYYLTWSVPYKEGTLTATAYDENGNKITETQGRNTVTTSGTPSKLVATVDTDALNSDGTIDADGYDLAYISVDVTDAKGVMDPNASKEITFNVTGDAKIVGVDNGDATDTDPYKPTDSSGNIVASSNTATRNAFNGKALVIVQSTKKTTDGSFTLTASADGLTSSEITVNTKAPSSSSQNAKIDQYKISKDYYVYQGVTPDLSTSVEATYSNGATKNINVTWDEYNLPTEPGVVKITGTLAGTNIKVEVNVHVVGNVVSALNYSTFTKAGVKPTLPKKVKIVLEDGTVSEEFAVTWDDIDESKYANEGKSFTVNGKVTVLNKTYDVTASVNVTDKETANTGAKLSELKVNDTSVNGFYEDINEYTVQVSDVENVEVNAEATDNAAITVLPKYNSVIRLLVQSEDHKTVNIYSIIIEKATVIDVDKSKLETAISDANEILNDSKNQKIYTEGTYNALKNAVSKGKTVLDNSSATQSQVDSATELINNSITTLEERKVPAVDLKLSVSGDYILITGQVDNNFGDYYEITKHGVLYIKQTTLKNRNLTVNTTGRTRVNFGTYKDDGSFLYRLKPSNKSTVYTMRAFIEYKDLNGKTHYVYSDAKSISIQ